MRVSAQFVAAMTLAAACLLPSWNTITAQAPPPAGKGDATAVLAAARQALGGEKKLAAVKTVTATGRTRQVRGDNLVPIEFEIFIELPDKYVRKDEIPAQETGVTATGFSGDELLQDPPPPPMPTPPPGATPPAGAPPGAPAMARPNPSAARVTGLKQDFTRLALGMFASSFPSYPLTFTYVAEAEAPQGKADVLEGKGPNNFIVRLFVSRDTHLPLMVTWTAPAPPQRGRGGPTPPGAAMPGGDRGAGPGRGAAPPAGAPPAGAPPAGAPPAGAPPAGAPPAGAPAAGAPPAGAPGRGAGPGGSAPPENRLYFADYRDVDGMQFPFRLRRAVGADTIEETTFDRYRVNVKIDPKRFEVRK
jgi:hypothetical protein